MKHSRRTVSFVIPEDLRAKIQAAAKNECRTVSNYIRVLLEKSVAETSAASESTREA